MSRWCEKCTHEPYISCSKRCPACGLSYTVLDSCTMMYGKVKNGEQLINGKWEPVYEDGKIVIDSSVAEELLPSCSGFFFGGTSYDQWYVYDVAETIKIIERVLATTDFETQMIAYVSSW